MLVYGDERFLKHEQAVLDQLLHRLPAMRPAPDPPRSFPAAP